jgi:RNA polymerase sigma factor (TIGR02999 family)
MDEHPAELTQLLRAASQGDLDANEEAVILVYEDLRQMAHQMMRWEKNQTLQPTALLNEAYKRLIDQNGLVQVPNRAYFFSAAAQAMRRILVEQARRRASLKRGGDLERQPFDDVLVQYEDKNLDLVAMNDALNELEELDPRQAKVVQLRWFAELTVKDVADVLKVSVSTVEQDWRTARAFLRRRMSS